jgi:glucose/arabinose dehydrogenase
MRARHEPGLSCFANAAAIVLGALVPLTAMAASDASAIGASTPDDAAKSTAAPAIACDPDNGGLTLPRGFCAIVVARDVGIARHMAVRPNGDLYVAIDNAPDGTPGGVLALRDTDGDGRPDIRQRFGTLGGNGIAWGDNQLYFSPDDRVLRYDFVGDELVPSAEPATVVSGLTAGGDHHRKTVVLDGAGGMFVNFGSASNACQVANREPFSPGIDPCPELATRAGVWQFDATATGQAQADGARFVTETRNMNALAINPADGDLYGVQNGRDQLHDNWPTLFDERDDALLPAEELFRFEEGKAYGWPYCYFDAIRDRKVLGPEYGGDGKIVGRCATRERPLATYPAHWAPLSMLFYTGDQFPKQYAGGLFIAFHGSRFDPSLQPAGPGFVVTFTPWKHGAPVQRFQVFADGFAGGDPTPAGAAHRPIGLAQAPDGSIYVSDDKAGWIWRVFYVGSKG